MMKDHRRRRKSPPFTWTTFFWCTLFVVFSSTLFTSFTILRRYHRSKPPPHHSVHPTIPKFQSFKSLESSVSPPSIRVRETVVNPNQAVILLNYPPSCRHFYTQDDFHCVYLSGSGESYTTRPILVEQIHDHQQIVRCPLNPRRLNNNNNNVSLSLKSETNKTPLSFPSSNSNNYKWHPLAYEALFDRDNTTLVFVKAFNLRPARESDPTRFQCLYGFDFTTPNYLLTSRAVSVAQEIIRCETPSAILASNPTVKSTLKVSVRIIGSKIIPSVAMPGLRPKLHPPKRKLHFLCVCTMLRNQARFLKEWIMYHSKIGVQRWFIYDNNSDDDIAAVIRSLRAQGHYNITRHIWPWIKSQEAGFAHCALCARQECEWVGFIDVDEFFNLKIQEWNLQDVIRNETARSGDEKHKIGEIRTGCFSFGPSGQKKIPKEGVMVGYTCRMGARERHKSIVRPEVLRKNLINVVHHFYLEDDYVAVDVDRSVMVINHYKYQVWKVFKDKFQRRVAAYVADWKKDENVGSKDRVPGLGTAAVEPPDWANRFCEVWDLELKNRVQKDFMDPNTHALPWQSRQDIIEANNARRRRRRRRPRPRPPPSSSSA